MFLSILVVFNPVIDELITSIEVNKLIIIRSKLLTPNPSQ